MKRFPKYFSFLLLSFALGASRVRAENVDPTLPEAGAEPSASTAAAVPTVLAPVHWVHPVEGAALPSVKRSFVYGWADPAGKMTLNGAPVAIHPGGGWLAMADYSAGANTLHLVYEKDGNVFPLDRSVTVGPPAASSGPVEALRPDMETMVQPGELVNVSFKGPAGGTARFQVGSLRDKLPMEYLDGTYRGVFAPRPDQPLDRASLKLFFDPPEGRQIVQEAAGRLTVLRPEDPWVVEVSTDLAILTAGPGFSVKDRAGYLMYPPPGVRLLVTGALGDELRVRLSESLSAWIGRDQVKDLPPGTPFPPAVTGSVSVLSASGGAVVRMAVSHKPPFQVTVSDDNRRLDVRFYGTYSNTDWIHLSAGAPWVRNVRWFQESSDVFRLSVETAENAWWGYDARYENGSFVLELRRPPAMANPRAPLQGLTVAIDAGHLPDTGAVGITGSYEKDINLAIAEKLKAKLEAEKARVVMVREGQNPVALYDRPKIAWAARADILISVHNNALPEGDNPFEKNGYGVYYNHPQSLPLAREIYGVYEEKFSGGKNALHARMRNDGLHWGNLALPRTAQMPSVLTESAYMILPSEEWWLRQPAFQDDCAQAMLEGLKRYVRKMRPAR